MMKVINMRCINQLKISILSHASINSMREFLKFTLKLQLY